MPTYVPAKINTQYIVFIGLPSTALPGQFQANPTLAAGDFQVSTDGGAFANLGTLPTVTPAAGRAVKVTLAIAEMNGANILVVLHDQTSPAEWGDVIMSIQTVARQIDDLAFPTTSGRSLDVTATGAAGIDWANVENPTTALNLSATNIDVDQIVASVSGAVGSVTGAVGSVTGAVGSVTGNVGGNVTGSVGSVAGAVGSVTGAVGSVTGNIGGNVNGNVVGSVASVTGNVGGNVTGSAGSVVGAVGSVTGNVGGNLNGNVVGSVASVTALSAAAIQSIWDRLTAALTTVGSVGKLIVDNLNAPTGSVPTAIQNADALLTRDWTAVGATAARSVLNAMRALRNKRSITLGTLTVTEEDDAAVAWQAVVTTSASNPVNSVDPT